MNLIESVQRIIKNYITENYNVVNFNDFPENIKKTLENEYGHYYKHNFDWNTKQDEFVKDGVFDGEGFNNWLKNNEREEFIKNLDVLITKTRQDLILKIKQKNAKKALENFEELIIPALNNEILVGPISKYLESALLVIGSVNTDIKYITNELSKAYHNAKNIIDKDGSINQSKITPSTLFSGDDISLPNFERFVQKNPEYRGVFNDWKKLFDLEIDLTLVDLNALRNSIPYSDIKDLYLFLVDFRNKTKRK